jgi:hypothetical protein
MRPRLGAFRADDHARMERRELRSERANASGKELDGWRPPKPTAPGASQNQRKTRRV